MKTDTVVRRFEVQALDRPALDDIASRLQEAAGTLLPPGAEPIEIARSAHRPTMSVRIVGPSDVVAQIRKVVRRSETVRVHRDWMDVPAGHAVAPLPMKGTSSVPSTPGAPAAAGPPDYPDRRSLLRIDPEGLSRDVTGSGEDVVVAIVDSGLDVQHPALAEHVWSEVICCRRVYGFHCEAGELGYDVTDREGHGTKLAGTILATANRVNGLSLLPVKFYDAATQPLADNAARAINVALDSGAHIINLSFDLGIGSNELLEAFRRVRDTDTLVVIAAGNTGSDNDVYPLIPVVYASECRDQVITVMATDWYDGKPAFSNFGRRTVDLAAPGVRIVSTQAAPFREYRPFGTYTGTSAAAATVTGAAALLKARNPNWSAQTIKKCLMETVETVPGLACVEEGRLDLGAALCWKP
jgi:subtilisin family serine protease